jgi:hypothetical protein
LKISLDKYKTISYTVIRLRNSNKQGAKHMTTQADLVALNENLKRLAREKAIKELKKEQRNGDTEVAHCYADDILCELLTGLGFKDVVDEYNKVHKWYA